MMGTRTYAPGELSARAVLDELADRWNRMDGTRFGQLFTTNATYVQLDGVVLRGRTEIAAMHSHLFGTMLYGTRLITREVESVRLLSDTLAVVVSTGAALFPWQREATAKRLSRQTMVLVKEDGAWMIAAFQNGRIKPFPTSGPVFSLASRAIRFRVDRTLRAA